MTIEHLGMRYEITAKGTITEQGVQFGAKTTIAIEWRGTNPVNQMIVNTLEELITGKKSLQGKV